jgi:transposase
MKELEFYENVLGLPELKLTSIEKSPTRFIFYCEYTKKKSDCPNCSMPTEQINQRQEHKYLDLKISGREVWLYVKVPQFFCSKCNRYFLVSPDWVEKGKSYTKRQAKWIFEMCEKQSFVQTAALANMSPKTVERLFYCEANQIVNIPERYANVRKLGIDEIAHRKGKGDYVCVLTDLERGIQLDVLPNRKKATLSAHFQSLGLEFCEQIEVVSCDIWKTYINVAKECFPNCEIVIDRFHVVKALNEVLDTLRKYLRRENKEEDCFKKLKWKLFKRQEKCDEKDRIVLQEAFGKSQQLEEIYRLRNTFNDMFDIAANQKILKRWLLDWQQHAEKLNYEPLNKFIKMLKKWKEEISAFANEKVSNAATEGLNNFLRYFKRISFGLPNFENMRLRILVASR